MVALHNLEKLWNIAKDKSEDLLGAMLCLNLAVILLFVWHLIIGIQVKKIREIEILKNVKKIRETKSLFLFFV